MKKINFNYTAQTLSPVPAVSIPLFGALEKNIRYTFSGKSALALLLRWYRSTGALRDRSDELLVPQWLGSPVYDTIHPLCFPTTTMNERVRGVMAYHQWGFPQDMDALQKFCRAKKLFLFEDCAHAFESYYHGARVGTFGDSALFSLAKFFPSVVGGAIYTESAPLRRFIDGEYGRDNRVFSKEVFANYFAFDRHPTARNSRDVLRNYSVYDQLVRCPKYSLSAARYDAEQGALDKRRRNYARYQDVFKKLVPEPSPTEVAPWAVPFFASEEQCKKIVSALRDMNVCSDVYHFDIHRNMIDPRFVPCVPLPCNQGVSEKDIDRIIASVQKAV